MRAPGPTLRDRVGLSHALPCDLEPIKAFRLVVSFSAALRGYRRALLARLVKPRQKPDGKFFFLDKAR